MTTKISYDESTLTPAQKRLLPILLDTSPRPDGTLTYYEEKVRLALPLLREQYSPTQFFERTGRTLDDWHLIALLHSSWNLYPEPSDSFISRSEEA